MDVKINSFDEYKEFEKKLKGFETIQFKEVKIKNNNLDIFILPMLSNNWIVTKRLRDLLLTNNTTSIEIVKSNVIF